MDLTELLEEKWIKDGCHINVYVDDDEERLKDALNSLDKTLDLIMGKYNKEN